MGAAMIFRFRIRACVVVAAIVSAFSCAANATIPTTERDALIALYTNTNGAGWVASTGWNGAAGTECTWFGVACDGTSAHVASISLSFNNLTGTIPSLDDLSNLQGFSVAFNQLTGTIPSLSGLSNLVYFDGSFNQLTGTIPSLSGLGNLQGFYVGANQLTGAIPDLTGTALTNFLVGANHLDGALPVAPISLAAGGSTLCPNDFPASSYVDDPAWDAATGFTPWYTPCNLIFANGFEF